MHGESIQLTRSSWYVITFQRMASSAGQQSFFIIKLFLEQPSNLVLRIWKIWLDVAEKLEWNKLMSTNKVFKQWQQIFQYIRQEVHPTKRIMLSTNISLLQSLLLYVVYFHKNLCCCNAMLSVHVFYILVMELCLAFGVIP